LSTLIEGYSMLIELQELWLLEKYLMADILLSMLAHRPASTWKIIIFPSQEEHLQTGYLFIWMHTLCTTLSDLLDQLKFWLHTVEIKDMASTCSSHQELTMDIVAVLQVRADKQLRQNSKKLTLASYLLNRHFNTSPKCN
jgi:hypothetical protein